jgi:hypothetical protein
MKFGVGILQKRIISFFEVQGPWLFWNVGVFACPPKCMSSHHTRKHPANYSCSYWNIISLLKLHILFRGIYLCAKDLPFAILSLYKHSDNRSLDVLLVMNTPLCADNNCVFQNVSHKIPYVKLLLLFFCWLLICTYLLIYYIGLIRCRYEIWMCYNNVQCERYVIEM